MPITKVNETCATVQSFSLFCHVTYLIKTISKIFASACGPHKMISRATCGTRAVVCPPLIYMVLDACSKQCLVTWYNNKSNYSHYLRCVIVFK